MDILFNLFLFSLLLIKLPPLYIAFIPSAFLTSHVLAKIIIWLIFFIINLVYFNKINALFKEKSILFFLLTIYFISQSISIINSQNIIYFLKSYQNALTVFIMFFLSWIFVKLQKNKVGKLINFIFFTGIFIILFEGIFLILYKEIIDFLSLVVQKEVIFTYIKDYQRGRSSLGFNNELFIPFFIFYFHKKSNYLKKTSFFVLILFTFFLSIISNFRTRIIAFFVSFSLVFTKINLKFNKSIIILTVLIISITALSISNYLFSFNILDRLMLKNKNEDISTIDFRIESGIRSIKLFLSSSITGVGLGNYTFTNNNNIKYIQNLKNYDEETKLDSELTKYSPHGILPQTLAETGSIGFISFITIIIYFIRSDIQLFKSSDRKLILLKCFIASSWSVFIFLLFNPSDTVFVNGWFWILRGFKEGLS